MRKHTARRVWMPLPPRGLRPRLTHDQLVDLGLAHLTNLDEISRGEATEETLWHFVGGVLSWSRAAELMQLGVDEMVAQLELATRLVERYGATGRVIFTGPEYQLAKRGVEVMDELARLIDKPTAMAAVEWGEARVNELASRSARRSAEASAA